MTMLADGPILGGCPTSVWNGSEWVPYVDPRESRPLVLDRRSDRRVLLPVLVGVVALGLILGAAGYALARHLGAAGDLGVTVVGTVDLVDLGTAARDCRGSGAYAGIAAGTPVTLTDGSGTVLASSTLEQPSTFGDAGCIFPFRLVHVPTTYDKYVVVLAAGEQVTASQIALEADDWTVHLSLDRATSAS